MLAGAAREVAVEGGSTEILFRPSYTDIGPTTTMFAMGLTVVLAKDFFGGGYRTAERNIVPDGWVIC